VARSNAVIRGDATGVVHAEWQTVPRYRLLTVVPASLIVHHSPRAFCWQRSAKYTDSVEVGIIGRAIV